MRTLLRLLLASSIVIMFAIAYRMPPVAVNKDSVSPSPNISYNVVDVEKKFQQDFNSQAASFIAGSTLRVRSLRVAHENSFDGLVTIESQNLARDFSSAARRDLVEVKKYRDAMLLDLAAVKYDLITLLEAEIRIWDKILSTSDTKLAQVSSLDRPIGHYFLASKKLARTYQQLLRDLDT